MTGAVVLIVCGLAVLGAAVCAGLIVDGVIGAVRFFRERAAVRRELERLRR